jgi:hypothetical protein
MMRLRAKRQVKKIRSRETVVLRLWVVFREIEIRQFP